MRFASPVLLLAALLTAAGPHAARAACESSVGGDQRFIEAQLAELTALLPALPAGWRIYEHTSTPLVRQTHCREGETGAYPAPAPAQLELVALPVDAPQFRLRALDAEREDEATQQRAALAKANLAVQQARQHGDAQTLQRASADLQAATAHLQASQRAALAAVRTLDSLHQATPAPVLRITLAVNTGVLDVCRGWSDERVAGAACAGRYDTAPGCASGPLAASDVRVARVRGWGDWAREGDAYRARFESARAARELPLYARYTLAAIVRGSDAGVVRAMTAALDSAVAAHRLAFTHAE